jgi:phosphoribosylaminoimidazolecarboxamide formyltransferase/IMP cyclohydrolase/phosphoribosylaminoimidazolecarboxamide formyltransferase
LNLSYLRTHFLPNSELSPLAISYLRARHADRISSYGDFIALSDEVDVPTARIIAGVVSDGIVAPGFSPEALEVLQAKRNGSYLVLAVDGEFEPRGLEIRDEFGLCLCQQRDVGPVPSPEVSQIVTQNASLSSVEASSLQFALIVARHTSSNSVVVADNDQAIGIGAGQQSRIAATRIACEKAQRFVLLDHPKIQGLRFRPDIRRTEKYQVIENYLRFDELTAREKELLRMQLGEIPEPIAEEERRARIQRVKGLVLASDGAIPFRDNIDRAAALGITHIIQPGGSTRDPEVTQAANEYGMVMLRTGVRYFLH